MYTVEVVLWIRLGPLGVVHQTCEYHDAEDKKEYQQGQFFRRGTERLDQNLQAGRMTGKLKQPHYTYDAQEFKKVRVFQMRCESLQCQVEVETQRRHHVDQIDRTFYKDATIWTRCYPYEELKGKPSVANTLDVKEEIVGVRARFVEYRRRHVACFHWSIHYYWHSHVRMSLQAE